jgi:NADH-quinone oxidoreductase subunit A
MRPACAARPARGNGRHVLDNYLPILIFLAVAGGFGLLLLVLGWVLGPRRPDAEKVSAYECGFEPFEDTRSRFDVRYYLVAILFIIFDLEIAFLFPWAVSLDTVGGFGLVSMGIFLAVLVVGFIYEWKKGALEWD